MGENKGLKLSPSRMKDYMQCPRLYYYKHELGLKTPATLATLKGSVAHYVFEYLFDYRPESRTVEAAVAMVSPCLAIMKDPLRPVDQVEIGSLEYFVRHRENCFEHAFDESSDRGAAKREEAANVRALLSGTDEQEFVQSVENSIRGWFTMEKPWKFEPTYRELYVGAKIGRVYVHGFIDRLDYTTNPRGEKVVYVSDYKTGKKPSKNYEDEAFFQLAVYSVVLKRMKMCQVDHIRLMYVNTEKGVISVPVTDGLIKRTENKIRDVGAAIMNSARLGVWGARKQVLCDWCHFQEVCPAFHKELDGLLAEEIAERLARPDYVANSGRTQDS